MARETPHGHLAPSHVMRALLPLHDTISGFEDAKSARFEEGLCLWAYCDAPANRAGSAYLLGYSIEIALKAAFFRTDGLVPTTPIDRPRLYTTKLRIGLLGVTTPPESLHSVLYWCDALRALRASQGSPLPPVADAELLRHTRSSYDRWWVEMRYKPSATSAVALHELVEAATWFDSNYPVLYR